MKRIIGWLAVAASLIAFLALSLPAIMQSRLPEVELPMPIGQPDFDPIRFFEGATKGEGTLYIIDGSVIPVRVESTGEKSEDGSLQLTQSIREGDKPPRTRSWTLRETGKGEYVAALSDARGTVEAHVEGNRMTIDYKTGSERIHQVLVLNPDRRTVSNRLDAYKWGLNVARLEETITQR
ncbi:DUF3833 family protein [Sphingomicrobium marinum]|uniref:DUF3833 family protein n=1 Tax=Sphingomicrobium marinum TaxID=1227950 RepID=UPI00223FF8C6|nr:DUF3833 family protein [Sphingomicrobium marinum]